ncbi:MAG: nucleotidyl transferase AbiEii/AbiGii toxin family protein [Bacteroidales bacterium]|nr:nucleotidyl transferase AbiEii/AbiGii toxin family protein [Bacteroidales bacterium]
MGAENCETPNKDHCMTMIHWQQYSIEERLQLLDITSAEKNLPRLAVEKDWWVTIVLKALSQTQYADLLSFKGGTSLSKGWSLIERFSEDIDIAIKREGRFSINGTSNTQLAKVRRAARHYVIKELPMELEEIFHGFGVHDFDIEAETSKMNEGNEYELRADTHPSVIYVNYRSILPELSEYMLPRVKVEISCLSMDEPVEEKEIRSFISEVRPDSEETAVKFKTVVPERTFLEKIFLLHEEFQKEKPRSIRMSRHIYDIVRIMDTDFGRSALQNRELYNEIVAHRSVFNKLPHVDYTTHSPSTINILPPPNFMEAWDVDYQALIKNFIYEDAEKMPFDELLMRMNSLTQRIRALDLP